MPLTRPIPKECQALLRDLRKRVPPPDILPTSRQYSRLSRDMLRFGFGILCPCPLGLDPSAKFHLPNCCKDFTRQRPKSYTRQAIKLFYVFWDEQSDARAAYKAVWPKGKAT